MAGASLLTLLDDIATVLDDIAVLSKVAAKKSAGVLGDDLALNAQQLTGFKAERELPIVWAVTKGSFINKLILVPLALLISAIAPFAVTVLLMLGGLYLCYEGFEKIWHVLSHKPKQHDAEKAIENLQNIDAHQYEQKKVKGAIRTDFILSAEIIVIILGTVQGAALMTQIIVLSSLACLLTIAVYGIVAAIIKLDDLGLYLTQKSGHLSIKTGEAILWFAPYLMKILSMVGTAAMFLVGGGILLHGIPAIEHWLHESLHFSGSIFNIISSAATGILAGAILLVIISLLKKLKQSI